MRTISRRRVVRVGWGVLTLIVLVGSAYLLLQEPRSDRAWSDEMAYTATTNVGADGIVHIQHMRDFTYGDGATLSEHWLDDVAIDPKDIVRMWFVLEPFAQWEAVGHTFLTFELKDGSAYSFSVEARREKVETYSAAKGFFRQYELAYTWGTERDLLERRLLYLKHPVYMYPLAVSASDAQTFFTLLLRETNDLAAHPRFYNTLTANCTNMLALLVNESSPDAIPWDLSWHLPGFSDRFLMKIGFIKKIDGFAERTQTAYNLTDDRAVILRVATSSPHVFGETVRMLIDTATAF